MKDKKIIESVLRNEATEQEAIEVAEFFGSAEGQLIVSEMIDADLDAMMPRYDTPAYDTHIKEHDAHARTLHNRVSLWWRVAAISTIVLAMGAMARVMIPQLKPIPMQTVCANRGEQIQVVLQDGTHVFLNAESRLVMPSRFASGKRTVTLVGEAYFEVESDKHHPFVVDLNGVSVEVLGTKFNVKAYENELLQVNLDEGHVVFHHAQKDIDMQPGEQLEYNRLTCQSTLYRNADTHSASAWREHRLDVSDMPMQELISILERKYDVNIHILDELCYDYMYSIDVSDRHLTTILKRMAQVSPIRYRYDEEKAKVEVYARK